MADDTLWRAGWVHDGVDATTKAGAGANNKTAAFDLARRHGGYVERSTNGGETWERVPDKGRYGRNG